MKLRYFFDWGGDYLWSADAQTDSKFGCPADVDLMPLSVETKEDARKLGAWFVEIAGASGESACNRNEAEFRIATEALYKRIVAELGPGFSVLNEM